jgi:hypothetical protein
MPKLEFNIRWRDIFYGAIIVLGIMTYCFMNRYQYHGFGLRVSKITGEVSSFSSPEYRWIKIEKPKPVKAETKKSDPTVINGIPEGYEIDPDDIIFDKPYHK